MLKPDLSLRFNVFDLFIKYLGSVLEVFNFSSLLIKFSLLLVNSFLELLLSSLYFPFKLWNSSLLILYLLVRWLQYHLLGFVCLKNFALSWRGECLISWLGFFPDLFYDGRFSSLFQRTLNVSKFPVNLFDFVPNTVLAPAHSSTWPFWAWKRHHFWCRRMDCWGPLDLNLRLSLCEHSDKTILWLCSSRIPSFSRHVLRGTWMPGGIRFVWLGCSLLLLSRVIVCWREVWDI